MWVGATDCGDGFVHRLRKYVLGVWHDARSLRHASADRYDAIQVRDKTPGRGDRGGSSATWRSRVSCRAPKRSCASRKRISAFRLSSPALYCVRHRRQSSWNTSPWRCPSWRTSIRNGGESCAPAAQEVGGQILHQSRGMASAARFGSTTCHGGAEPTLGARESNLHAHR